MGRQKTSSRLRPGASVALLWQRCGDGNGCRALGLMCKITLPTCHAPGLVYVPVNDAQTEGVFWGNGSFLASHVRPSQYMTSAPASKLVVFAQQ